MNVDFLLLYTRELIRYIVATRFSFIVTFDILENILTGEVLEMLEKRSDAAAYSKVTS